MKEVVCYPITVTRSTPFAKYFSGRRELGIFLLILAIVAGLVASRYQPHPRVTVSGLALGDSAEQVQKVLGTPSFRSQVANSITWEYWPKKQDQRQLSVTFEQDKATRIEGGDPEVDGQSCLKWSSPELLSRLGSPSHGGAGGEKGGASHTFLAYPEYRLLVQQENGENHFILFQRS